MTSYRLALLATPVRTLSKNTVLGYTTIHACDYQSACREAEKRCALVCGRNLEGAA